MNSEKDILCIGETMVLLTSSTGEPLETSATLDVHVAGAESNVAAGMSHLGQSVSWFGRVGDDSLGQRVRGALSHHGIDISMSEDDPHRHTGLYLKEVGPSGTTVRYYRQGSAASAMAPGHLPALKLHARRLCHLSGITAALSASCDKMMGELVENRHDSRALISFDVNYRPGLWRPERAAPRLFELAAASDIVIVGRDEAQLLWDTADADSIRRLFPEVPQLIVKDNDLGATAYVGRECAFVPALQVDVVEAVGAGDAFAAGYLTGLLNQAPVESRLRLGHLMAGYTLQHVNDLPPWPDRDLLFAVSTAGEQHWEEIRSTPLSDDLLRPRADR